MGVDLLNPVVSVLCVRAGQSHYLVGAYDRKTVGSIAFDPAKFVFGIV
jgi:hypothetical protein